MLSDGRVLRDFTLVARHVLWNEPGNQDQVQAKLPENAPVFFDSASVAGKSLARSLISDRSLSFVFVFALSRVLGRVR